jgi:hypothetical protein
VVHGRAAAGRRGGIWNFELGFGRQERGWPICPPPQVWSVRPTSTSALARQQS